MASGSSCLAVLRQAGREGYRQMLADDCRLSRELYRLAGEHPELEAVTQGLSITTFRFVPRDLRARALVQLHVAVDGEGDERL